MPLIQKLTPDNGGMKLLDRFADKIEGVFHLGAISDTICEDWNALYETNVLLSAKLSFFCAQRQIPFLYASSASVYGNGAGALNKYAKSKREFDDLMEGQCAKSPYWYGLRFFNIYGPGEEHKGKQASIPSQMMRGHRTLFDIDAKRDFIYVDDVVSVMLHMWKERPASGIYDVGSGTARDFRDIAAIICPGEFELIPLPSTLSGKYQFHTQADLTKLRQAGYTKLFPDARTGHCKDVGLVFDIASADDLPSISEATRLASMWNDRGIHAANQAQYAASRVCFQRSIQAERRADGLANYANTLRMLWQFDEAEKHIKQAFALEPHRARSWWVAGMLELDRHDPARAIKCLDIAVPLLSTLPQVQFTRACAHLAHGNYLKGFQDYEIRLKIHPPQGDPPMWNGENLAGKTLLIDAEQGMGDSIMFARYIDPLDCRTIFRVPAPLLRYFRSQGYNAIPKANAIKADYRIMSMSLPILVGLDEALMLPEPRAPEPMTLPHHGKFRIGIVWRSKAAGMESREAMFHGYQKSCPLDEFLTLAEIPNVQLFSLQVGSSAVEADRTEGLVESLLIHDFEDMAGYVAQMDMVVSVDTAPAHLAGPALGKPGIVLLNCVGSWQWQLAETSPWYPSLRLCRQPSPFDWTGAMAEAKQVILDYIG